MAPLIHTWMDLLDILGHVSHVNRTIAQNKGDDIVVSLNNKYNRVSNNVSPGAEWLFDDYIAKM